jgi:hypothetical protein
MTNEQKLFMNAYGKCMAVAPDHEIEYFFQYKDKTQEGTFREQQLIREGITYWGHIEDAWLLWLEATKHTKPTTEQILDLEMAVNLAGYFVEEHQDDDTEQWHTDSKRVTTARAILQDMKGKL